MSHFMIYVPRQLASDATILERVGLPDLVANVEMATTMQGPDGSGLLCFWREKGEFGKHFLYQPTEQTWIPAVPYDGLPAARYFVGIQNDSPPTPNDLRYANHPGHSFVLGNGQSWTFPLLGMLDRAFKYRDDGQIEWEPIMRFKRLCETAENIRLQFRDSEEGEIIPLETVVDVLTQALQVNYRLTRELVSHLELFHTGNIREPFWAAMGIQEALQLEEAGAI